MSEHTVDELLQQMADYHGRIDSTEYGRKYSGWPAITHALGEWGVSLDKAIARERAAKSPPPFDPTKPVQYRNGEKPWKVIAGAPGDLPIKSIEADGDIWEHKADGTESEEIESYDLVNIPEPPKRKLRLEVWVNLYQDRPDVGTHMTREYADLRAGANRLACKLFVLEAEEGEGL